jgi:hypothetical protein
MSGRSAIDSFSEIATLRVELKDPDPLIWRELEVPTSITLKVLHDIIQTAMRWLDYHLWEMVIDRETYGLPMDEEWGPIHAKQPPTPVCAMCSLTAQPRSITATTSAITGSTA